MSLWTLASGGLSLPEASELSVRMEEDWRLQSSAITISEIADEVWTVIAYFADRSLAATASSHYPGTIAALPDADWVRLSLQGLPPVQAGRFYLHGSHDAGRSGGISLEIDAGTAFGTGHHGTTEGCLLALDQTLKARKPHRILDLGCGTGVLAIAAARATGYQVLASDIDPEAVRVARLNARRNGARLQAVTAAGLNSSVISGRFDLIFANILARPLVMLAQGLTNKLRPRGVLILSGLTHGQAAWVFAAYRNRGLVLNRRIRRGAWTTLVLVRMDSNSVWPSI